MARVQDTAQTGAIGQGQSAIFVKHFGESEESTLAKLDPRGPNAAAAALDENQTAKFLTEAKRLAGREDRPVVIVGNEYYVE
jgi:hypothetical protein